MFALEALLGKEMKDGVAFKNCNYYAFKLQKAPIAFMKHLGKTDQRRQNR